MKKLIRQQEEPHLPVEPEISPKPGEEPFHKPTKPEITPQEPKQVPFVEPKEPEIIPQELPIQNPDSNFSSPIE